MNKELLHKIFIDSSSQDELFDAFVDSLKLGINDFEHYKPLLANRVLSEDEIKMFTEKLAKEIKEGIVEIYLWTGQVFYEKNNFKNAFEYFQKSFQNDVSNFYPLLNIANLYNFDFDDPLNKMIIDFIVSNVNSVNKKSRVYLALANIYKRIGDFSKAAKYNALAYRSAELEED